MTNFTLKIAGRIIAVSAIYETSRDYCREYLCSGEADFAVSIAPEDIAREADISRRTQGRGFPAAYLEAIAIQRKIAEGLFDHGVLLFHGSVVAVDGEGYLFTATSGTGKSTHARLWRELLGQRAVMVNDDKPFLSFGDSVCGTSGTPSPTEMEGLGRDVVGAGHLAGPCAAGASPRPTENVGNGLNRSENPNKDDKINVGATCGRPQADIESAPTVLVHGSPWNGKHRLGSNISVPLRCVCILERGEENEIRPIPAKEALFMLLQQSNRPMDGARMPKYMDMIDALSRGVSFYRLRCNMDIDAARLAYEAMSGAAGGH